jgi:hypothetical protein
MPDELKPVDAAQQPDTIDDTITPAGSSIENRVWKGAVVGFIVGIAAPVIITAAVTLSTYLGEPVDHSVTEYLMRFAATAAIMSRPYCVSGFVGGGLGGMATGLYLLIRERHARKEDSQPDQ